MPYLAVVCSSTPSNIWCLCSMCATAEKSIKEPPKDEKKADIVATEGTSPSSAGADDGKTVETSVSPPSAAPMDAATVPSSEATPLASAAPQTSEAPPAPVAPLQLATKAPTQLSFISSDELSKIGQAEKTFGVLYLEHMFGLLAAILPDSSSVRFQHVTLLHMH